MRCDGCNAPAGEWCTAKSAIQTAAVCCCPLTCCATAFSQPFTMYLQEKAAAHFSDYANATKLCIRKLAQAYGDLGLSREEQLAALDKVADAAQSVWTDACETVDLERQGLRDKVRAPRVGQRGAGRGAAAQQLCAAS